ncbi:hypothetical protein AXF42_Ash021464 [Apostasia shenzhenica]|uniref:Uncharacterized protein n=1 Tax=Apostasia shenzhenica TaxID=1088818 RepID=A0A2H9ZY50_9ASPA|nr:hypothetical protein AXF42_Ash021464 [Apostasia shenzhenica]
MYGEYSLIQEARLISCLSPPSSKWDSRKQISYAQEPLCSVSQERRFNYSDSSLCWSLSVTTTTTPWAW